MTVDGQTVFVHGTYASCWVCVCVFFYQDCNTHQIFMNHWSKIHDRANIVVRMKHDGMKPGNMDMCTLYNLHFHIT